MKIGIAGPVSTENVAKYLAQNPLLLPKGICGAPLLGTLIGALLALGHTVSAYTLDPELPAGSRSIIRAQGPNFTIYYGAYRRHSFRPNGSIPGRALDLFKLEREAILESINIDKPYLVHAHWTYEFAMAALESGLPHLVTCHDSPRRVLEFMPNAYRLVRYFMARWVFKRARSLTAVSEYLKREVSCYTTRQVEVIPNPLPSMSLTPGPETCVSPPDPSRPKVAMVLNGWSRRKNPKPALVAFSLLRQWLPEAELHLFGVDFGVEDKAALWCRRRRISDGMVFHGAVDHENIMQMLPKMTLLLHPALEESFGMVIVEAMACGVPVIGGASSGAVPWLLGQGSIGVLTDVTSPESICQSMLRVLTVPGLHDRHVRAGFAQAKSFEADVIAERYEAAYDRVMKQCLPGPEGAYIRYAGTTGA